MTKTSKLVLAAYLLWVALVVLLIVGETSGAISTTLFIQHLLRTEDSSGRPLNPFDQFDNSFVAPRWARIWYVLLAPGALALVVVSLHSWIRKGSSGPTALPPEGDQPRPASLLTPGRYYLAGVALVRVVRICIGLSAWWVGIGALMKLLQALASAGDPHVDTGGSMAIVLVQSLSSAFLFGCVALLRMPINWLYRKARNQPHPGLPRWWSL